MPVKTTLPLALAAALLAGATLAHAFDTTPSSPAPAADLKTAQAKIAANDFNGAIPILKNYIVDHPRDANGFNLLGYSLRKTGQTQLALQYYGRALDLVPQHLGANEYLGELYVELGQMDKAKERLAVLQAACGNCEQEQDLAAFIQKGPGTKARSW
jgi:Flp pilus assembly protein TadD